MKVLIRIPARLHFATSSKVWLTTRGSRRLVLSLVYLQIGILDVERQLESLALNRTGERAGDIEIECVAEFVDLGSSAGLDSRRQVAGIVAAEAGLAE